MLSPLVALVLLLTLVACCAAVVRYWQVVEQQCRQDWAPDPALRLALQQQQRRA